MLDPLDDARAYASRLDVIAADREKVIRCLADFPSECKSRGMFFEGVLAAIEREKGIVAARKVVEEAGIGYRITNFGLYPHRDFYKVFYRAARILHPKRPIGEGMNRIAQDFYPAMFAESLAGKTMAVLLGKDPLQVLGRFVDAYKIACPWADHACETLADGALRWKCKVEPCPFYERTIEGIATGMVTTVTGARLRFRTVDHSLGNSEQRFVFDVQVS